ncbi:TetR/AcrR family transcriptional regulator [Actinoplanes sp. TFC3]|uniref:TetR/AcrR family transcriptional regulator n=1 Tax=Actinoplanes sp. TFC3 TaxID=1710355 RepID=UPI0008326DA9|nr:TetR/AcrR family transcriptional regulator [Actinoplanes sp. TFC3]
MSSPPDLTARARIREAAITLIAERGVKETSIRDIAQAAEVSSGLLRHHFGSKEGLRDACDDYVLAEFTRLREPMMAASAQVDEGYLLDVMNAAPLRLQNYVVRSTMDGSPTGTSLFFRMIDEGERWLKKTGRKSADPRAYSAVLCAMKLGMLLMREQIAQALDEDPASPNGQVRMLKASVEIFSAPVVAPELAEQLQAALDQYATGSVRHD